MSASAADWAIRYIKEYQFRLVPIPKGTKGPVDPGWNLPGRYVTDPEVARQRWNNGTDQGIGVVLGPSGVCSADIDFPEHAERVLSDLGIDLPALRKATPTIQGNPARYRMMFKAPCVVLSRKALVWPPRNPGEKPLTLFELRAGDIQDALPPTLHPDFPTPYTWLVPPNGGFPPLPEALLELWLNWGSYQTELKAHVPLGGLALIPLPHPGATERGRT